MKTIGGSSFDISRTIANTVAREGQPVVTTNAQADPRFSSQESVIGYNLRSILCVPLRVREKITGVIYADNRIRAGLFGDHDRDLLAAFANQAALAIENARLFEQVKQQLDQITEMKALMDNVFASIPSGVISTDVADTITLFNRAAETILGVPTYRAIHQSYRVVLPMRERLGVLVEDVKRTDRPVVAYEDIKLPSRGKVNLSLSVAPLKDADDATMGVAIVVDDLTEKKKMEAKREVFRRMVSPSGVRQPAGQPGGVAPGRQPARDHRVLCRHSQLYDVCRKTRPGAVDRGAQPVPQDRRGRRAGCTRARSTSSWAIRSWASLTPPTICPITRFVRRARCAGDAERHRRASARTCRKANG